MKIKLFMAAAILVLGTSAHANVVLPDVLSSGMVLQRDQTVPIWGRADAGEVVSGFDGLEFSRSKRWAPNGAHD